MFESHSYAQIPIPEVFYSDITSQPIDRCVQCDMELIKSGTSYILEKAIRKYPDYEFTTTIFEYAMCMTCAEKMNQAISKESTRRMSEHFQEHANMMERMMELVGQENFNIDDWLASCIFNGKNREELDEYQISCQCVGDQMMFNILPFMVSGEAANEITELLSPETLGEYNDFVDDNFGLPPEFKKALKDRPSVLI